MSTVPETPLSHTERARLVLEHIRAIKELIGGFTFVGTPDPRSIAESRFQDRQPTPLGRRGEINDMCLEPATVGIASLDIQNHLRHVTSLAERNQGDVLFEPP